MEELKYPIGKFHFETEATDSLRQNWIQQIANLPGRLREAVKDLSDAQLDTPYRPEGWTIRQVVHHLADSHIHSYIRFRFGLTENEPPIKPFDEVRWAELEDARQAPVGLSLGILEGIHARWTLLARSLQTTDFSRSVLHPERGMLSLNKLLNLYSWHGQHHLAHIENLKSRMGW
jgi:hypothetical protein